MNGALMQDLRYGLRQLVRSPGFTAVAVVTLALGIGANTALFTLANSILGRPMPEIGSPERLAWVTPFRTQWNFSYPDFRALREQSTTFQALAAFDDVAMSLSSGGTPVTVRGSLVSGNFFDVLGVRIARGRGFLAEEDSVPGRHPVAVLSHSVWLERFEGSGSAIGRSIKLNGAGYTVVGIAPPGFNGVDHGTPRSVWIPMAMAANAYPQSPAILDDGADSWLSAVGRLKQDVTLQQASAELASISQRLAPGDSVVRSEYGGRAALVRGGNTPSDGDVYRLALVAFTVTLLVLVIACANVSNMMLGRAVARRREIAVRLSMGAARRRVVRQLLTESLLLAAAAAVVGALLATWAVAALTATIPVQLDLSPDARVLAFTVMAVVITTVLFGLMPALNATRGDVASALRNAVAGFDSRRSRLQRAFVTTQISLSIVLLVTCGMFLSSLFKALRVDVRFDASERVIAATFDLGLQGYSPAQGDAFLTALHARLLAEPGVDVVTFTNQVPLGERLIGTEIMLESDQPATRVEGRLVGRTGREAYESTIAPDYFRALQIPIVRGRDFAPGDAEDAEPVAIVSEDFARDAWPGGDALGKRIRLNGSAEYLTVVAIAAEAMTTGLESRRRPTIYVPRRQRPLTLNLTVLVRAQAGASHLAPVLRRAISDLDADLPVDAVQTLAQFRSDRLAETRLGSTILAIFGALALLLATVGVYAVMAFSVTQRTREIGVRVALGAAQGHILRLFVSEGMRLAGIGIAIGLALGAAAAKALASLFLGLQASDAVVFVAVAALLAGAAFAASAVPARRAARVEPMQALRSD